MARNLLTLVEKRWITPIEPLGKVLSRQLNSALAARYGAAAIIEDVSLLLPVLRPIQQRIRAAIAADPAR